MKKHHWHVFRHEKLFEKHPQPHCQTRSNYLITTLNHSPIKILFGILPLQHEYEIL